MLTTVFTAYCLLLRRVGPARGRGGGRSRGGGRAAACGRCARRRRGGRGVAGEVEAAAGGDRQLALLAPGVAGADAHFEFVHTPVVALVVGEREAEAVAPREVADDTGEPVGVVGGAVDAQGLAARLF